MDQIEATTCLQAFEKEPNAYCVRYAIGPLVPRSRRYDVNAYVRWQWSEAVDGRRRDVDLVTAQREFDDRAMR
ncbi:MAG: hypothetical protein NVS3B17_18220 [Vulcanimicrobiaceae bacterium]